MAVLWAPAAASGGWIYDNRDQWTEVAGLPVAAGSAGGCACDGALYVVGGGGEERGGVVRTNAFRFDGLAWTEVPGLPAPRRALAVCTLENELFAIGGLNTNQDYGYEAACTNVFRYVPGEKQWEEVRGLPFALFDAAAAAAEEGPVLIGGFDGTGSSRTNVLELKGENWVNRPGLPDDNARQAAAALDGRIYSIAGGKHPGSNVYSCVPGNSWNREGDYPIACSQLGAVAAEGRIYAMGGNNADGNALSSVHRLNRRDERWEETTRLPEPRFAMAVGELNGSVYAVGGFDAAGLACTNVYRLSPAREGVSPSKGSILGGDVVVIRGEDLGNGDIASVTLCGVAADIQSQSPTQVVVKTGGTNVPGKGDVRVVSASLGESMLADGFEYEDSVDLQIESNHGEVWPAPGPHVLAKDSQLVCGATTPDTQGTTQYVCAGWAASGSVTPLSGSGTQAVVTVYGDGTLTWLWTTNYQFEALAGPYGSVEFHESWYPLGADVDISGKPDVFYHFSNWTGDVPAGGETNDSILVHMDGPKTIMAHFAPDVTVNTGTPHWWLDEHGFSEDFEAAATNDPDEDSVPTSDEYVMDTDPKNESSYLRFTSISSIGDNVEITWEGGTLSTQRFETTENFSSDVVIFKHSPKEWDPAWTNIPPTPTANVQLLQKNASSCFYRIRASR